MPGYIPPADAPPVVSSGQTNCLVLKAARTKRRGESSLAYPPRLLVSRSRPWWLLIFNTQFFTAYSSYWRGNHGGAASRVLGR